MVGGVGHTHRLSVGVLSRLRARWEGLGLTESEIIAKLEENDLPNGRLVRDASILPDFLLMNH